jgi:hypothetical protein
VLKKDHRTKITKFPPSLMILKLFISQLKVPKLQLTGEEACPEISI